MTLLIFSRVLQMHNKQHAIVFHEKNYLLIMCRFIQKIIILLFLCGCATEQIKTPSFQGMLVRELESQISKTKDTIGRQKEKNEHLNQLLTVIHDEEERLHLLVEEKKVLLDRMKNNIFSY